MCSSLTDQVRSIAVVTTAVARGDLTQKIEIQVEGEMSTLKGIFILLIFQCCRFLRPAFPLIFIPYSVLIHNLHYRYRQLHGRSIICLRI